jgi:hypothetical protein
MSAHHKQGEWTDGLLGQNRPLDRDGGAQRLAHQPAMDAELPRHPLNGADPELVFASDLLEQLHRGFPPSHPRLLPPPSAPGGYEDSSQGWAIRNDRTGPTQSIKDTQSLANAQALQRAPDELLEAGVHAA